MSEGAIRPATTILLLRPSQLEASVSPLEVFMVKRNRRSSFMASAYVFPGGRVDDFDADDGYLPLIDAEALARIAGRMGLSPDEARPLVVAGIRESFEEAGVLLAYLNDADDADADRSSTKRTMATLDLQTVEAWRPKVQATPSEFLALLNEHNLVLAVDRLHVHAHWITPEIEPKRYDTWFLVCEAPRLQELSHDEGETVASAWLCPKAAISDYRDDALMLAPPTLRTLEDLAQADSIQAAVELRDDTVPVAIMPQFYSPNGEMILVLPGDPAFEPTCPGLPGPTRFVMRESQWWSEYPEDAQG